MWVFNNANKLFVKNQGNGLQQWMSAKKFIFSMHMWRKNNNQEPKKMKKKNTYFAILQYSIDLRRMRMYYVCI